MDGIEFLQWVEGDGITHWLLPLLLLMNQEITNPRVVTVKAVIGTLQRGQLKNKAMHTN